VFEIENRKFITPLSYILLISFFGFITGVFFVAFKENNTFLKDGILNKEFIAGIQELSVDKRVLFFLCLGKRMRDFLLLLLLAYSSVNVFFISLFFGVQGFYIGSVMELLAIQYGIDGLFMYIKMVFPQGLFYSFGFVCLGCWCLGMEKLQTEGIKRKVEKMKNIGGLRRVLVAFLAVLIGIIMESYVGLELLILSK